MITVSKLNSTYLHNLASTSNYISLDFEDCTFLHSDTVPSHRHSFPVSHTD